MTEEWYYAINGQQMGPTSALALREMLAKGAIMPSDLVWCDGMSNWAPAAEIRELCPGPHNEQSPNPALRDPEAPPPPRAEQRPVDAPARPRWDERQFRRKPATGMSTGAKIAIFGGIAAVVVLGFMLIVGIIAMASKSVAARANNPRFGPGGKKMIGGRMAPPMQAGRAPGIPQAFPNTLKQWQDADLNVRRFRAWQFNTYEVDLQIEKAENQRAVQLTGNQVVRVTVIAPNGIRNADGSFDVDVYIYDDNGVLVAWDNRDDNEHLVKRRNRRDPNCDVTFLVPQTGTYHIVVVLDRGTSAKCTVRY
jgi:hypothetical protein